MIAMDAISDCRDVVLWIDPMTGMSPAVLDVRSHDGPLLAEIIDSYQVDPLSTYHKQTFHVRQKHAGLLRRVRRKHGHIAVIEITGRTLIEWHAAWKGEDKVAMAHSMVAQLRTVFGYGFTLLSDPACERASRLLSKMKFPMAKTRTERITAEQAEAVRTWAHIIGWHSIALAQAMQFELMLRQKDCIGQWFPLSEPGEAVEVWRGQKWNTGLRWFEIDDDLILRHITSKRQKPVEVDLKLLPMVMEELEYLDEIPSANEPVIICEATGMPYSDSEFRRKWRIVAKYAGVPDHVFNMDSRSGGISEAFEAGVAGERIQKTATHSDIRMTQKYNRGDQRKASDEVARGRMSTRCALDAGGRDARWRQAQANVERPISGRRTRGAA